MTVNQWAVIAAIRAQEALCKGYRFLGPELRIAKRMVNRGLLRPKGKNYPNEYKVTAKGTRLFEEGWKTGWGRRKIDLGPPTGPARWYGLLETE